MVHQLIALRFILGRHRSRRACRVFEFFPKQRQPVLLVAFGLIQKLAPFRRAILLHQALNAPVKFFDFLVEVLQKRGITDGQILLLAVELVVRHCLDMLGLFNGRVMLRGQRGAQCGKLA